MVSSFQGNLDTSYELTVRAVLIFHVELAETEVAEGNVSCIIKQNVFRLEITVDDLETVQTFQGTEELCCVESRPVDVESLFLLQVVEKFTTVDECQHQVELFWRLERELERNDERVVDLCKHRSFSESMGDFGTRNDMSLANGLQGVDPAGIFLPVGEISIEREKIECLFSPEILT